MTSRWSNPMEDNRLTDLEGTALPGGTLEFYIADTSTPLAVYSDPELTVSLGSTLTADAFALIEDFHLAAGTAYKTIAKDSGGATKWTRDDVWSLDSSTDTRLDDLESSVQNISVIRNSFANSGCGKQRIDSNSNVITAPTISATFQIGTVAGHYGRATNVSAGTITRGTTTAVTSGYYLALSGVTTTDAAAVAEARFVVPAADAGRFQGSNGTFTCLVYHDTGTAKDYTITAKKMDSEDDVSSLTTIDTSSATSVTSGSWATLTFSVSAFGDCRNGLVFDVSCACGVQTTKAYWFTMPMLDSGLIARTWTASPSDNDRAGIEYKPRQYHSEFISSSLRMSVDADADHDIQVAAGGCRDSSDSFDIDLSAVITKQLDAAWAEGDDAGGLPSGVTLSGPEWLYFFLIAKTDGTVDAGFDDNASATNLLVDASTYTYYRHIGSVRTDGSDNIDKVIVNADIGKVRQREVFTSNGTFYVPPLVDQFDVMGVAGGGANNTAGGSDTTFTYNGVTCTGGGGNAGNKTGAPGDGGTATGGDINVAGGDGSDERGGGAAFGLGSSGGPTNNGHDYGGGAGETASGGNGGGGGGGFKKLYTADSGASTASIVIGAGGNNTYDGGNGVVIVEW